MITNYIRPKTIEELKIILSGKDIAPLFLSGGVYHNLADAGEKIAIDLQLLNFREIKVSTDLTEIGGAVSLQSISDQLVSSPGIKDAILLEGGRNIRNTLSLHTFLQDCKGRSALACVLSAMDARLELFPSNSVISMEEYFNTRYSVNSREFVSKLSLRGSPGLSFHSIARTPQDQPIICAALVNWNTPRLRMVLGGFGDQPTLVYEGPDQLQLIKALDLLRGNLGDEWATDEYRINMALLLVKRCFQDLDMRIDGEG